MAEETLPAPGRQAGSPVTGRTLGPYRIEKQIGRGGMSVVYEAMHVTLERTVALKVLLPSLSGDKEFVERFLAEARAAARLDYPHIVPIYDSGEINGVNYIAMKLLEGRDLKTVLDERRAAGGAGLSLERTISIISQAAGALEYAHQHHLVHRDIKPANIYVDDNDRVTLVDFGIARALDRASATLTGTVIGTPTYMSPEQAQGQQADYRSDIYSLGVVLYELLTGTPPFAGNPQTIMYAHVFTPPPALENLRTDLPPGIGEVVQRALAKDPQDRYQTAGALALALTNAAGGQLSQRALESSGPFPAYTQSPSTLTDDGTGPISGPHTPVPGGITYGTLAGVETARPSVAPVGLILAALGVLLAIVAAAAVWAFVFGPFAGGDGQLIVNSDPQGAIVTVDGNRLGVTPLGAQKLSSGSHELVLEKPTYATVKRTERISARGKDTVNAALTPLPAFDLLTVKQANAVAEVVQRSDGTLAIGEPISTVKAEQQFWLVAQVVQKEPGQRDVGFTYEWALFDPSGGRLPLGNVATGNVTVNKDEQQGKSLAFQSSFHAFPDGTIPVGKYQFKFLIDGKEAAAKQVELIK